MAGEMFVGRAETVAAFAGQVARLGLTRRDGHDCAVFVLTGESGFGKTRLATELLAQAPALAAARVHVDWEYGKEPAAASEVVEQLADSVAQQSHHAFKEFTDAQTVLVVARGQLASLRRDHAADWASAREQTRAEEAAARGIADLTRATLAQGMPDLFAAGIGDLAAAGTFSALRAQERFLERLRTRGALDERFHAALRDPAAYLTHALVTDLRRAAARQPLLIWLDSCERVRRHLPYLTANVIAPLLNDPILWVVSGQRLEPDDPVQTVPGWARPVTGSVRVDVLRPFSSGELSGLLGAAHPDLDNVSHAAIVGRLCEDTLGIPVLANWAVHDHAWLADMEASTGQSIEDRKRAFFDRLFGRLPEQDLLLLSILAMTGGHTRSPVVTAICSDLGITNAREEFARLELDPFLLPAGKLHELRRAYLRDRLLRDDAFAEYRERIAHHYVLRARNRWLAAARRNPDFAGRFDNDDAGLFAAVSDYCAASFWYRFRDGCRETFQLWAQTLIADDRAAARLLRLTAEFAADPAARRLERQLLRTAAALCAGELAVPGCVTRWHQYSNAAELLSTQRRLTQRLGYPEPVLFALDLGLAYLSVTRGIEAQDPARLLGRHRRLEPDAQAGFATMLGRITEAAAARVTFDSGGQPVPSRTPAAVPALRHAVRLAPRLPRLRLNAAKVLFCAGAADQARQHAHKAIELASAEQRVVLEAAELLWKLGDGPASMAAIRELALVMPHDPLVLSFGYWHQLRTGAFAGAAQWAQRLLAAVAPDGTVPPEFGFVPGELTLARVLSGADAPAAPGPGAGGIGTILVAAMAGDTSALTVLGTVDPASRSDPVDAARLRLYGLFAAHVLGDDESALHARFQSVRESVSAEPGFADLLVCVCDVPAVARAVCARLGHVDCALFHTELDNARQILERRQSTS